MNGDFEADITYHGVEIYDFPGAGDTTTLRKFLNAIDPDMDIEAAVQSAVFYSQLTAPAGQAMGGLQDTKNIKIMEMRMTPTFLSWGRGERDTGNPAIDRLSLYKSYRDEYVDVEGTRHSLYGRLLAGTRNPAFQAIQLILSTMRVPHFKVERLWRKEFAKSLESTLVCGQLEAVRVDRFQFAGAKAGPSARMPKAVELQKANMQIYTKSDDIARHMVDNNLLPFLSLGNSRWSMTVSSQAHHLCTHSERQSEENKRREAKNADAVRFGNSFDPERTAWRVDVRFAYDIQKGANRTLYALQEALLKNCGGELRGLFAVQLPCDETNRLNPSGSHYTSFGVQSSDPELQYHRRLAPIFKIG